MYETFKSIYRSVLYTCLHIIGTINQFHLCLFIICLLFYVPLKNFSPVSWRRHLYWWRATKFRPKFVVQDLRAGRNLYRATPTVTRGLGFSGLIQRTAPFSCLLRHTRGCGEIILTPSRVYSTGISHAKMDNQGHCKWSTISSKNGYLH
jgi:hypothetical protein